MIFTFCFIFILFWVKCLKFFSLGRGAELSFIMVFKRRNAMGDNIPVPSLLLHPWRADSGCRLPPAPPQHGPVRLCVADSDSQCSPTRQSLSLSEGEEQTDRLQQVELVRSTPMSHWKAGTVQAWLEVVMAMPMYVKACAENVKSGKVGHLRTPRERPSRPARGSANPELACPPHPQG